MSARKSKEIKVKVVWEIDPDPSLEQLEKWHRFWGLLFRPIPGETGGKLSDSTVRLRPSQKHEAHSQVTFKCKRCGQTWPVEYLPDGNWAPGWWKCPEECYDRKNK